MSIAPGTRLGPYEVEGSLGTGGMGEVYRARDVRLDRVVALKVLPSDASHDAERRERFQQEARAASRLNHPHICTIHDVGEQDGRLYIAMELVEGRTLADMIPPSGLPAGRLLAMAIPLADAASAAHEHGITHRDLKPANVMVTSDGRVKVLDFGLAKLKDELAGPDGAATCVRHASLTGEGRVVGTASYMSPEQAEGRAVDLRSDIFSLGVILYEMATGERPFKGDSVAATLSSILRDTPRPVSDLNPALPRDLAKIVRRALNKDPEHRYQSAKDLRNDLEELKQDLDSGGSAPVAGAFPARPRRAGPVARWVAAGAVAVAAAWLGMSWLRPVRPEPALPPAEFAFTKLTSAAGIETSPSLSPDGRWVVYSSAGDIQLQSVGGQASMPINLTKDEPAADSQPAFSPDGELIAFRSARGGGGIFLMGRTGEGVRRLTDRGFDPAWTPDGRFVVFGTETSFDPESRYSVSEGWKVDVATGALTRITAGDFVKPAVSPNLLRIAYWGLAVTGTPPRFAGNSRDLWTIRPDGGDPVRVTDDPATDWSPAWSADGRFLYFASDRGGTMNLWRVAIDEASGRVLGAPEAITTPAAWLGLISRSGDGRRFAYAAYDFTRNVARVRFDPAAGTVAGAPEPITTGTVDWWRPAPSPDGTSVALTSYHRQEDLYLARQAGSGPWTLTQLTNDAAKDRMPRWSPDGRQIAFYSNRGGVFSFWTIDPDGGDRRQRVSTEETLIFPVWSPDGSRLAATLTTARRNPVFALGDGVVREPVETLRPQSTLDMTFAAWSWSPDGRKIAGHGWLTNEVSVYSFDDGSYTRIAEGYEPVWLGDGRRLVCAKGGRLFLAVTATKQSREILAIPGEVVGNPSLSRDDRYLYFTRATTGADIWLMTVK